MHFEASVDSVTIILGQNRGIFREISAVMRGGVIHSFQISFKTGAFIQKIFGPPGLDSVTVTKSRQAKVSYEGKGMDVYLPVYEADLDKIPTLLRPHCNPLPVLTLKNLNVQQDFWSTFYQATWLGHGNMNESAAQRLPPMSTIQMSYALDHDQLKSGGRIIQGGIPPTPSDLSRLKYRHHFVGHLEGPDKQFIFIGNGIHFADGDESKQTRNHPQGMIRVKMGDLGMVHPIPLFLTRQMIVPEWSRQFESQRTSDVFDPKPVNRRIIRIRQETA